MLWTGAGNEVNKTCFCPLGENEIATQNWNILRDTRKIHRKICGASRGVNDGSTFGDNYQGDLHGRGNF